MLLRKLLSLLEQGIAIDLFVNIFVRIQGLNIAGIGLSLDFRQKVLTLPLEKRMSELDYFGRSFALMEVVHVKLAYKRVQIAVLEVSWQCLANKLGSVHNLKAQAVLGPLDDPILFGLVDDLEQFL